MSLLGWMPMKPPWLINSLELWRSDVSLHVPVHYLCIPLSCVFFSARGNILLCLCKEAPFPLCSVFFKCTLYYFKKNAQCSACSAHTFRCGPVTVSEFGTLERIQLLLSLPLLGLKYCNCTASVYYLIQFCVLSLLGSPRGLWWVWWLYTPPHLQRCLANFP